MRHPMRRTFLSALVLISILALPGSALAQQNFYAFLTGFEENPQSIFSTAYAELLLTVSGDDTSFDYQLTITDGPADITQGHIHFGQFSTNGGVMIFLCGGDGRPACPQNGTVSGTVTAANVGNGAAGQGIAAGEFSKALAAMRYAATYANVHSMARPGGIIRGQLFPY